MTRAEIIAKYLKAIGILEKMGLSRAAFISESQRAIKSILQGRNGLAAFDISPVTKALLSTDENWALAASIVARSQDALDIELVSPGRDWIIELSDRAYKAGNMFEVDMYGALGNKISAGMKGIDATTLRMIHESKFELVKSLASDQVDFLRERLTAAVIENRSWMSLTEEIIREGKIPALVDSKGRLISMEVRVDTIVRTETSRIAEQGTRDKAREIYGEAELWMRWHTIMDGRERETHAERDGKIRKVTDWQNTFMPGEEVNCRCWGEYGSKDELQEAA